LFSFNKFKVSILITGGLGYIGSQLSYILSDNNLKHIIVDNLSTGHKILKNPKVKLYIEDISNKDKLKKILIENNIKCIMHLAASILVPESMEQPDKYYKNNVINLVELLEAAKEAKIKYFIFSSTCAVYGDIKKNTISENDPKIPTSIYGMNKLTGERLIKFYAEKYKFKYAILRYFNVIGADSKLRTGSVKNTGHLFGNIIDSYLNNKMKISIFGTKYKTIDGSAIRDYIDVQDIAKIHLSAYKKIKTNKKSYEINCGIGNGFSVLKIIKTFEKIIKKKFILIDKKPRPGDTEKLICNTRFLKKTLKLNLKNNLANSITNAINWKKKFK